MKELSQPNSAPDKEIEEKKEAESDDGGTETMGQTQSNFGTTMHDFYVQSPDVAKSKSDEKNNNGLPSEEVNDNNEDLL